MNVIIIIDHFIQLMADDFTVNGSNTFIPNYLNTDLVSLDNPTICFLFCYSLTLAHNQLQFNMTAWRANHGKAQAMPPLLAVMQGLKRRVSGSLLLQGTALEVVTIHSPWCWH
jgi:hypothetical protein